MLFVESFFEFSVFERLSFCDNCLDMFSIVFLFIFNCNWLLFSSSILFVFSGSLSFAVSRSLKLSLLMFFDFFCFIFSFFSFVMFECRFLVLVGTNVWIDFSISLVFWNLLFVNVIVVLATVVGVFITVFLIVLFLFYFL